MHPHAPQRAAQHVPYARTQHILGQLVAEEKLIEQRKKNVRMFGANWLRPPGVAKTFQALLDEQQEKKEQAEIARREAQMAELTAAEEAQRQAQMQQDGAAEDAGDRDLDADIPEAEERDLDDDIPEAEEAEDEDDIDSSDIDNNDDTENGTQAAEPSQFNEQSLLEGSLVGGDNFTAGQAHGYMDAEDAELDGRAQDMRDLGIDRDLDDDVPEAGAYEHTDTEVEDSSDDCSSDDASEVNDENSQSQLERTEDDIDMETSFVSHPRSDARRRRSGVRRGRWSGGSDVLMDGSELEASPSTSASNVMQRLRAARRRS